MIPTCDSTKILFEPLYYSIKAEDIIDIRLTEKGAFLIDCYRNEDNYRIGPSAAIKEVLRRLPECKHVRTYGTDLYEAHEVGATDCCVELISKLVPRSNLFFVEPEAEKLFYAILDQSMLADNVARIIATYKEEKIVPNHNFEICESAPLSPYQQLALVAQQCSSGFGLFMEQGTGKTPIVIAAICNAAITKREEQLQRIADTGISEKPCMYYAVIICPNQVRQNWLNEFEHFATQSGRITILRGTAIDRIKLACDVLQPDETGECLYSIAVCGYQTLWRSWETLKILPWDLAVLDEAHAIKDIRAKQSQCCLELRDKAKQRICLTGTPIANTALDLYTLLEFMDKGGSGFSSWDHFRKFYGVYDHGQFGDILVGIQNMPFLQERLARKSFFISKKEAMPDLPDKVYDIVEVEMIPQQEEYYNKMVKELALEIEADLNSNDGRSRQMLVSCILTKLLRLAQITSGFISWSPQTDADGLVTQEGFYEWFESNPKIDAAIELLQAQGPNDKSIIWACWLPDVEYLCAACESNGIDYVRFTGSTNEEDRQEAIRRFNEDPNCKVFIGTASSGGSGLNLLGYPPNVENSDEYNTDCTMIIYFSQNWSQIHRSQSEDRAHRRGTRRNVRIVDICVPGTIDQEIRKRVLGKKEHALEVGDLHEIMSAITASC